MQRSPGGSQWTSPDQILAALAPLVNDAMQASEAGLAMNSVVREATLAAYLVGRGLSPAAATNLVLQWRTSGAARGLVREQTMLAQPNHRPMGAGQVQAGTFGATSAQVGATGTAQTQVSAMPGQTGGMLGQMGAMLGQIGAVPGQVGAMLGQMGAVPGQVGAMLGQMGGMPGRLGISPAERDTLLPLLREFIHDQVTAAPFYGRLAEATQDEEVRKYIQHAQQDEIKHARMLQELYRDLAGPAFEVRPETVEFTSLASGLKQAMDDEYEAFEAYRDVYLGSNNQRIRNLFFELMTDELEHATRFNYALQVVGNV